jgi:hypothetical protein
VKGRRESISQFRRHYIIEESQGIKHGSLDIGNEGSPREEVGIPERDSAMRPYIVINEFFPGIELANEIETVKDLAKKQYFTKKQYRYNYEQKNGD